jgi:signal transduction histidine kinase
MLGAQRVLYAAAPVLAENGQISGIVYIATPLPAAGAPIDILWQLTGALFLAVLLAAFAGRFLARQIARPLEGLAEAATAISNGDLQPRVSMPQMQSTITELESLKQTFNSMADNLRRSDETKKAFIADVTHELRTPLTVIKGTIETLEDGALDDAKGRGPLLTSMGRETDRLIRLVNELLVLTRADAGSLQLNLQPLDLGGLIASRCEVFSPLAAQRGITLRCWADGHPTVVRADPDRLSQVLDNLLDNAIRHSPENSTITLTVRAADQEVECSVSDQGTGIPAQHLPFVFERFYRVDAARSRSRNRTDGGTGLGLAIAQALVHAQGGRISARSREGQGTTMTIWLPKESSAS